eukprot:GHVS01015318.1.p1 GENE.GHVS01015318.1~~GHVS01015318.1.p1  ORF type:complete len:411 (+),score=81.10 GHVS01015318.1:60-1292(+)
MSSSSYRSMLPRDVFITGAARTPIGSFLGSLSSLHAHTLGSIAISHALKRSRIEPADVQEVVVGQVLTAATGQAPHRQAAIAAGIPACVDVFAVNKVCSSGLKAVCLAAQSIGLGQCDIAVAVGMESMSNVPYYLSKARSGGYRYGHGSMLDGVLHDGLWDPYNQIHMGKCAENTASNLRIGRVDQDVYAVESYRRAAAAWNSGGMQREVVPVHIEKGGEKHVVEKDEEYTKIKLDKVSGIKPAFDKLSGTITAANSSKLSDGAAAVVLMSEDKARQMDMLMSAAKIVSFADAAVEPIDFPIAPAQALRNALSAAKLPQSALDYHEINEAFAAVALANIKLLELDPAAVNVHGGAVALGHPLGMSGCRILMSLLNVLESRGGRLGAASICNGGGGATAMIVESSAHRSKL